MRRMRIIKRDHHDFRRGLAEGSTATASGPSRASSRIDRHAVRRGGQPLFGELGHNRIRKIAADGDHVVHDDRRDRQFPSPTTRPRSPPRSVGDARLAPPAGPSGAVPRGCGGATTLHARCTSRFGHHCVADRPRRTSDRVHAPPGPEQPGGRRGRRASALAATLFTPAALLGPNDTIRVDDSAIACGCRSRGRTIRGVRTVRAASAATAARRRARSSTPGGSREGRRERLRDRARHARIRRSADESRTITTYAGTGCAAVRRRCRRRSQLDEPTGITFTPAGDCS